MPVNPKRIHKLNDYPDGTGPVIYWMNRDMRASDNWALLHAQDLALRTDRPLMVVYNLVSDYLGGGLRQLMFKIEGLKELESSLLKNNIPLIVIPDGSSGEKLVNTLSKLRPGTVITDFCPLKICDKWINSINKKLNVSFLQVDAHNIVPCREASPKQEFGAYTIRPKIHKKLPEFMEEFPRLKKQPRTNASPVKTANDWNTLLQKLTPKKSAPSPAARTKQTKPEKTFKPGEKAARATLKNFLDNKLKNYDRHRNDPAEDGTSNLSPYLHYGMISAQRIALETEKTDHHIKAQESFLEELIVRRELADNYCFYNKNYDNPKGFPAWAQKTLHAHKEDPREYLYTKRQLENAQTHDQLWNAAQLQMVKTGKMHNYMRMYWAKKILEWTSSPAEAQKIAIYLNDKYELDGRDPNGYAGIAWSIGGVHDRAWGEREIFGKIRYMSYNGCKSKFDINKYIQSNSSLF